MARGTEVSRVSVTLPPLPEGHPSSLQVIDITYDDGTVDRRWLKDDVVVVVAIDRDVNIVSIEEKGYQHCVTGYVDKDDSPEYTAHKELLEETGYQTQSMELVCTTPQDSGGSDRKVHIFLARSCEEMSEPKEDYIKTVVMKPGDFLEQFTARMQDTSKPQRGALSFLATTLVFLKLGFLKFSTEKE